MIIPVRCYSCGKTIAHLYEPYRRLLDEDFTEAEALEAVGAVRYCCRRMLLTHIDLIDGLMPYSAPVVGTMQRLRPPQQQQQQQHAQQAQQAHQQSSNTAVPTSADAAATAGTASSSAVSVGGSTKRNALA